jgi:hypothetical protein
MFVVGKKQYYYILITVLIIVSIAVTVNWINSNKNTLNEAGAVALLKNTYPEFKSYPNDNLPPQSIRTERGDGGWYVAFVQEGSGRPILGAKCFLVTNDKEVHFIGELRPAMENGNFSIKNCR